MHHRIQHGLIALSVIMLIMTGFPLKYPELGFSHAMALMFGGAYGAAMVHRFFGLMMSVAVAYHLLYLIYRYFRGDRSWEMIPTFRDVKEAYETLFELPYMTVRQISIMKMTSEEEVRAKADELGYVASVEGFRRAHESSGRIRRGDKEPEWLLRNDPHDECGDDIEARILACYRDGLTKAKSIADLLAGSRNLPVTVQQVSKVIKKHTGAKEEVSA